MFWFFGTFVSYWILSRTQNLIYVHGRFQFPKKNFNDTADVTALELLGGTARAVPLAPSTILWVGMVPMANKVKNIGTVSYTS